MLLAVILGLITGVVCIVAWSPFATAMCTLPFVLLLVFGSSRGKTHTEIAFGSMGAFLSVAAWLGFAFWIRSLGPNQGMQWAGWLGITLFALPLPTLVLALVGVKMGTRWEHRFDDSGEEGGLSFLKGKTPPSE